MSNILQLISPPSSEMSETDRYKLETSVFDTLDAMADISNVSRTSNADFSTLSAQGTNPTTQANGDNFEFIKDWLIVGAGVATYSITATTYPESSDILSNSNYFINAQVFTYAGSGMYFYQRYMNKVRFYQSRFVTFTIQATNNDLSDKKLRPIIQFNYVGSSELIEGKPIYLQPGFNEISVTIETPNLIGKTVLAGNYVEFRLDFSDLYNGAANIDFYLLKTEFGKLSTPLP